jgi:hypothetical protein
MQSDTMEDKEKRQTSPIHSPLGDATDHPRLSIY